MLSRSYTETAYIHYTGKTVRQKVISNLLDALKVPASMIEVEEHLSHYGIKSKGRADIVILGKNKDNDAFPLTVIECKAPNIPLDEKALNQALNYSDALGSVFTILINGDKEFCYKYEQSIQQYAQIEKLPEYNSMLTGECVTVKTTEPPEQVSFLI
ncbi:MAG: type I restriction enzyme HsdR N-terminal domain-containing protein [Eubacteriales bacterium]|nr:type I restriction enzyme HsdR N-terminal domain-containing protein [Eubacteriales bacterium]